jgi:Tol biopolymer transport system component/predicted Ser/Thr protein kinase
VNPGDALGHYRILEPIGKGGMGEVFLAEDTRLHRRVALKILPQIFARDPDYRDRFEREAQAVAALNHPNIVTIHSVEEDQGRLFLTMELVDGKPLGDLIPRAGMPIEKLLRIGIEVADAMAAAQAQGITHRDLKPANVMVTAGGRVKVLDFGLAKMRDAQVSGAADDMTRMTASDITGEGKIIGTVAYMSPEQAEGKPVDPRSDIFSFGVVLHELATGERPFKGDTNVSVLSSILKDTPPTVTDSNPGLPSELSRIVKRCLAKDPARRYQTAADLRNELEDLKQDTISGITTVTRTAPPRRPRLAWVAMALGGLAVAAASVFLISRARAGRAPEAVPFTIDHLQRLTTTGTAFLAAISPDGRYVVHVKVEGNGAAGLWTRQTATTSDVRIVPPGDVRFDGVSFSPDANYIYYNAYEGVGGVASLYKVPVLGGTPVRLVEDVDSAVAFSPDQKQIAFMRGTITRGTTDLVVAGVDGSNPHALAHAVRPDGFLQEGPSWSPDGRTILATAFSGRPGVGNIVYAVDAQSGATQTIGAGWGFLRDVQWLPDGQSFLVTGVDFSGMATPQIWRVAYPSGERSRVTNDLNSYIGASLSADGRSLATVQTETIAGIYVADGSGGEPRRLAGTGGPGHADGTNGIAWLSDGRIVYTSIASGLPQLWIADGDGANARQLTSLRGPAQIPWAAPDGKWIYFTSYAKEGVCLFRIAPDGSGLQQLTKDGDARNAVVSPDGRTLYFTSLNKGQPRLMSMPAEGGAPAQVSDKYFRVRTISPDGARLLGDAWSEAQRRSMLAMLTLKDGREDLLPEFPGNTLFMPDGGLAGVQRIQGKLVAGMWPKAGGPFKPLAPPTPDTIYASAISARGEIAMSRGQSSSDVVLIKAK